MIDLKIKYVDDSNSVVAFTIGSELFFIKFENDASVSKVYDHNAMQLHINNVDAWLQIKTQQRYSYQSLRDMSNAFLDGLLSTYNIHDLHMACNNSILATIESIMHKGFIYDYALSYWIEILGSDEIEKYLRILRNGFDKIRRKSNDNKIYSVLCRILYTCRTRSPHCADVCELLIRRLGKTPADPEFPDTTSIDNTVVLNIKNIISHNFKLEHKNIPDHIVKTADDLIEH